MRTYYEVPFFENTPDDTHCFQASFRMILKYYMPEKDYSWEDLDAHTGKVLNKATWPMAGMVWMEELGFAVEDVELFDYTRFVSEKESYIKEFFTSAADWVLQNTDFRQESMYAQKLLSSSVRIEKRIPILEDIRKYLLDGSLCILTVNAKTLNQKEGFVGHAVVVVGFDDNGFIIHDPGRPALKDRYVANELLEKAWADPGEAVKALMAFKYIK